jgi:hypothetical protein
LPNHNNTEGAIMATQHDTQDTQLQELYHSINECRSSLLGFDSSFLLNDEEQNSAVHFLLNAHAHSLQGISNKLTDFINKQSKTTN